jgi:POT family proton-dependent oligopeptide transporter
VAAAGRQRLGMAIPTPGDHNARATGKWGVFLGEWTMERPYRTVPEQTSGMPSGVPYIVVNEAAERFSYYGMRAILFYFMTHQLMGAAGSPEPMTEAEALPWYHLFLASVYVFPLLGAIVSDVWLGKYRTIISLSLVYCLGHVALAADETRAGLAAGLGLIAIGSGGIKPCVSANVGDQFGPTNQHLVERVFGWFYLAINLGAAISASMTPILLKRYGSHVAFGVPGALMFVATLVFWLGRHRYVHAPPAGMNFLREARSPAGLRALARLSTLYLFVAVFWCLYDQTSSKWIAQAEKMDLNVPFYGAIEPAQTHVMNPVLILMLVPLFTYVIYPALGHVITLTPLRKVSLGFFLTALAFVVSAVIEGWIAAGERPSIGWQAIAYLIITSAEVMVSVTCLEYSYTQAPRTMKSLIMALNLLSVALGNALTVVVNKAILTPDGKSRFEGPDYYWLFSGIMLAAALGFMGISWIYLSRQSTSEATA